MNDCKPYLCMTLNSNLDYTEGKVCDIKTCKKTAAENIGWEKKPKREYKRPKIKQINLQKRISQD